MREYVFFLFTTEYIEDICPYATFQLNKQTYSESSYSGNIYSGPYHSVRGSFVYHDSKPDGYHVNCNIQYQSLVQIINIRLSFLQSKEPEYTKVRRKGNRLRDPHSESQGNGTYSNEIYSKSIALPTHHSCSNVIPESHTPL